MARHAPASACRWRSSLVDTLELAALADLPVLVSGQRLDDEMARVAGGHGPALSVVVTDGHGANAIVTLVARIERKSYCCGTVDTSRAVLDAYRHPDLCSRIGVRAPGADAIDAGNTEIVTRLVPADAGRALKTSMAAHVAITGIRRNMEGSPTSECQAETTYITGRSFVGRWSVGGPRLPSGGPMAFVLPYRSACHRAT
jgi:hypothetical protein